jgi:enoyl-CoA hydratase/carnithine racemase
MLTVVHGAIDRDSNGSSLKEEIMQTNTGLNVQTHCGVLMLTIDNPAQRNALRPETSRGLAEALRAAANDPTVGAAVLTGAGEHFCSGGNLPSLQEYQGKPRAAIVERIGVLNELVRSLRQFPKPVIAAVEGAAFLEKRPARFPK